MPLIPKGLMSAQDRVVSIVSIELPPGATLAETEPSGKTGNAVIAAKPNRNWCVC